MNMMKFLGMMDVFPGYKTYITMGLALGMVVCQMAGYHVFSQEEWAAVGITGGIFWKMGIDRKPKAKSSGVFKVRRK